MKKLFIMTSILVAFAFVNASATIINVPADYDTIQEGIDASSDGDTVLVQPDTYVENINFNGHNIVLGSLFLTTGDTSYISGTKIDGNSLGPVVTLESGEDTTAAVTGFTIRNGYNERGGGIYSFESQPNINYNVIHENVASYGGGIYCGGNDRPKIEQNVIINNNATSWGGGLHFSGGYPMIIRNLVMLNHSDGNGGGISLSSSHAVFEENIIADNEAFEWGGGVFCEFHADLIIKNNIVIDNSAFWAGGIIIDLDSDADIYNNIIIRNSAIQYGGGLLIYISDSTIRNNIIFGNIAEIDSQINLRYSSPEITYNNIQGGWEGEGNIDVDPLFRDPENGDFHLMATYCGDPYDSPCIDMGHPDILDSLLDCNWGLGTVLSDMGAYGGGDSAQVGIDDLITRLPSCYRLKQNYPNPFNPTTTISFAIERPQFVTLKVYNLLGREVQTLIDEQRQAGMHTVTFDASDLSSGIYFYKIQAGDNIETKKMVLLK